MDRLESQHSLYHYSDLRKFLSITFCSSDLMELRLIESWHSAAESQSRIVARKWGTPAEVLADWPYLIRENKRGVNVFFGVNPRLCQGSKKQDVAICRTLWADLDDARPTDIQRWASVPTPSVIVDSGRGVHLYWRLKEPVEVQSLEVRTQLESTLQGLYQYLRADSVQDVTRLLRLPGLANVKNFRNGHPALACRIAHCDSGCLYEWADFQKFVLPTKTSTSEVQVGIPDDRFTHCPLQVPRDMQRIRGLTRLLTKEVADRSKRDFFVVMKLLELGCSHQEVESLVSQHSKFVDNPAYLQRTILNASQALKTGN